MPKDVSPEEKLLGLIKKKRKTPVGARADTAEAQNRPVVSVMAKADERVSKMLKSGILKNKFFEPSALKAMNRYLAAILGILILYLLADMIFIRPYKDVQALIARSAAVPGEKRLSLNSEKVVPVKDYSAYSNAIPQTMVFGQSSPAEEAAGDIAGQIGLVGIITGDSPQAIIEDKKAQKTYYLNKGQSFNGYMVEDILEDRVILACEGKKMSLFL
ncbi:MAG: hypothetical protein Q7S07_02125 [Candidatus Omnitrophota bacterium]|nr:hypothetical protein [Candidatus Omnitrophota bacterium]